MRYVDWDALRQELFFTESEERAITKRAAELLREQELTAQIAQAVAEVDSHNWGMKIPGPNHPLWQVYAAYGEAVLKVLQGGAPAGDHEHCDPPPSVVTVQLHQDEEKVPESSIEELDHAFAEASRACCPEGNHSFCAPGCTGPTT